MCSVPRPLEGGNLWNMQRVVAASNFTSTGLHSRGQFTETHAHLTVLLTPNYTLGHKGEILCWCCSSLLRNIQYISDLVFTELRCNQLHNTLVKSSSILPNTSCFWYLYNPKFLSSLFPFLNPSCQNACKLLLCDK